MHTLSGQDTAYNLHITTLFTCTLLQEHNFTDQERQERQKHTNKINPSTALIINNDISLAKKIDSLIRVIIDLP